MVLFLLGYKNMLSYQKAGAVFSSFAVPRAADICWHVLWSEEMLAERTNQHRLYLPKMVLWISFP